MIIHIALYKWKVDAKPEAIQAALTGIEALASEVPDIVEINCAENTSPYSEGYTHVILVRGKNQAALDAYRKHPQHAELASDIEAMEDHGIGVDFDTNENKL